MDLYTSMDSISGGVAGTSIQTSDGAGVGNSYPEYFEVVTIAVNVTGNKYVILDNAPGTWYPDGGTETYIPPPNVDSWYAASASTGSGDTATY